MSIFRRIADSIYLFLTVDCHLFWIERPPAQKGCCLGCLGCLGLILSQIVFYTLVICFIFLMTFLNSNKTYELLYPAEEIVNIQVIHIDEDVGLYYHPIDEIPDILKQATTVQVTLDSDQISECVEDLYALPAGKWWNDPNPYIEDGTFLITYSDGSLEWICADGTFYLDQSNNEASMTWFYFIDEDFDEFLRIYGYREP